MRIVLDDKMILKSDRFNFILAECSTQGKDSKEPGEIVENNFAFNSTLGGALDSYKNVLVKESEATSIKQLREDLAKINEKIESIAQELNI